MRATQAELSEEQIKRSPPLRMTSDDFHKRAKYYRLAAAVTDIRQDAVMFNDLAMMFDQIAYEFDQAEARPCQQIDETA